MTEQDAYHIARSRYLDAMSLVEREILRLLVIADIPVKNDSLGLKLKALQGAKPSSRLSKANVATIQTVAFDMEHCLVMRADIVHSRMTVVDIDGATCALFMNVRQDPQCRSTEARLLTLTQFHAATSVLRQIAARLSPLGKPVVSVPKPTTTAKTIVEAESAVVPIRAEG